MPLRNCLCVVHHLAPAAANRAAVEEVEEGKQDEIQAHYCTSELQQNQSEYANLPGQVSKQSAGRPVPGRGSSHSALGLKERL